MKSYIVCLSLLAASGGSLFQRICRLVQRDSTAVKADWKPSVIAALLIMALSIPTGFALTARSQEKPDVQAEERIKGSLKPAVTDRSRKVSLEQQSSVQETVMDLQCRLRPDKTIWTSNETPKLFADIPAPGNEHIWLNAVQEHRCQVEINGHWYQWVGPKWYCATFVPLPSDWLSRNHGYLRLTLDQGYWQTVDSQTPLELSLGECTVRLAWAGRNQDEGEKPIRILSNPVKIEIQAPVAEARKLTPGEEHRKRVADAFHRFREKGPVSSKKQEIGSDLRFRVEGYPIYTWQDIPILLELAESNNDMTECIPTRMISSYIQGECREGMVALWLIEGLRLRRRQKELTTGTTPGDASKWKGNPYDLPLNPMCRKKGWKRSDCENSAEIHQEVLKAYQSWWLSTKDLSPGKASAINPLGNTTTRW